MNRSVGLREDQRWSEVLVTRILQWLPDEPRWYFREQARSHKGSPVNTKFVRTDDLLWERAC